MHAPLDAVRHLRETRALAPARIRRIRVGLADFAVGHGRLVGSTLALVVLGTGLTVVSGPLFDVTGPAAMELRDREPYIQAVFPREAP